MDGKVTLSYYSVAGIAFAVIAVFVAAAYAHHQWMLNGGMSSPDIVGEVPATQAPPAAAPTAPAAAAPAPAPPPTNTQDTMANIVADPASAPQSFVPTAGVRRYQPTHCEDRRDNLISGH